MESFEELFEATLKDIYFAEKAILKALPKMAKTATSDALAAAFEKHLEETEQQIARLEEVFKILGKKAQGKKCAAIEGILEEGDEAMKEVKNEMIRDAAMLAAAQSVEHYEISRYGTLVAWAEKMDQTDIAELLQETLDEEKATDEALTDLALSEINVEADDENDSEAEDEKGRGKRAKVAARER